MARLDITVLGAGINGLWAALTFLQRGHCVTLIEAAAEPFTAAASRWAGAMLAPYCEEEAAEPIVRKLGLEAIPIWRETYPGITFAGSIVLAAPRDQTELRRYARDTQCHETIDATRLRELEPDLAGRFHSALFFEDEGHMPPLAAMAFLLGEIRRLGGAVRLGTPAPDSVKGQIVDCRGLGARHLLPRLRAVRGERLLVRSRDVSFSRPIRLLHPRHPLYVVPWGEGVHVVGATVIESEDPSPMTVRSALELLGLAYALHPGFGEAEIVDMGAGLRPAFPDNIPKVLVAPDRLHINGAYRHGFLMSPILGRIAADYLEHGTRHPDIVVDV